jgi:molybdenum cofactor guanylyltransferase
MNGYVLAGGKSSRMGQDKGLMRFGSRALVEYSIFALSGLADKIYLVTANREYEQFHLPLVEDTLKEVGPAGGILTALQHTDTDCNIVLSCDMPFMQNRLIQSLLDQIEDASICIYRHENFIEPLCGIYRKKALPDWQAAVDAGTWSASWNNAIRSTCSIRVTLRLTLLQISTPPKHFKPI